MKVEGGDIIEGHVMDVLKGLPDESVHCVVTSPPYWGLRDYGLPATVWGGDAECEHGWGEPVPGDPRGGSGPNAKEAYAGDGKTTYARQVERGAFCRRCNAWRGQLGLEPDIELFIEHIVAVFREVRRVLRKDGVLWLNMGDCYTSGDRKTYRSGASSNKNHQVQDDQPRPGTPAGLKPKDLVMMPVRIALALQADGWWVRSPIVWHKPNPMPESTTDRPTSSHESIFLLVKNGCTPIYWTHRDRPGTRTKPPADYRWVRATGEETAEEPEGWRTNIIICPACEGTRKVPVYAPRDGLLGTVVIGHDRCGCAARPEPETADIDPEETGHEDQRKPKRGEAWEWRRVNLWRGRAYFYDADAVRQEAQYGYREHTGEMRSMAQDGRRHTTGTTKGANPSAGRNLRSVWTFPTRACSYSHYATFPYALPERCILAGTSERGCCPKCGAPWERVVEKERRFESGSGRSGNAIAGKQAAVQGGGETHDVRRGPCVAVTTTGWRPTCECFAEPIDPLERLVPCTVIDPFAGTGTTLLVAKRLGRAYLGIELNPKDVAYARKQLANQEASLI